MDENVEVAQCAAPVAARRDIAEQPRFGAGNARLDRLGQPRSDTGTPRGEPRAQSAADKAAGAGNQDARQQSVPFCCFRERRGWGWIKQDSSDRQRPTGNLGAVPADVSGLSRARSLQLSDRRGLDSPATMRGAPAAEADLSGYRGLVFLV